MVFRNTILKALNHGTIERLCLRKVVFEVEHELEFPGNKIANLYFVEEGMASMTTTFLDGSQVEVGMFGYESAIGVSALMGSKRSLNRVYTQIEGYGFCAPVEAARREFERGTDFQRMALAYVQSQLLQAMQSAGCNITHSVEQRLARWLLLCADRTHSNSYHMSHEFLAQMLGSTRSTVTTTMGMFQEEGIITYNRGQIEILDCPRLERLSCECYAVIRNHLNARAEFNSGVVA
jgi:CRP-like cAMP-binding protein